MNSTRTREIQRQYLAHIAERARQVVAYAEALADPAARCFKDVPEAEQPATPDDVSLYEARMFVSLAPVGIRQLIEAEQAIDDLYYRLAACFTFD